MRKIFGVTALIFSSHLFAQQDSAKSLDEVVITATKYPVKQSQTGKVVTVVTREQIERSAGKDLSQVLSEQAGVNITGAYSNPGKDKSVFLRGAGSAYTLFLLDGVPFNDPSGTGGTFDIRLIPLEQIERIEILKGSQSTLYGSNAIAGVINIITRKAQSEQTTGSGLLSYGSYNTFKGDANFNKKGKVLEYNLGYEYVNTAGITEAKDTTGKAGFDRDGFDRQSFQANVGINVTDQIKLSPYFRYTQFRGGYDADAFIDALNRFNATLVNTGLTGSFKYNGGSVTALYGYDKTHNDYTGYVLGGKFQHAEAYVNQKLFSELDLLAGVSYQTFKLPTLDTTNSLFSPYASLVFHKWGLNVEAGGRYNKHNRYGNNFTYSINPSWLINNSVKIFADLSTGFRAPSINELFGPYSANPNLKPERSQTFEAGVQAWALDKKLSLIASYFNRDVKDVITYSYPQGYINRDRQKDHGVEAELNFTPTAQWSFRATYTYVTGKITQVNSGKDTSYYNLIRRPKNTVNLFAGFQATKNLFISTSLQSFGDRDDIYYIPNNFYTPELKLLKAYALWNAYAEYKVPAASLTVFVDAKNLTNKKDYYEVYGYNVQGFTINGGIRFKL